MPIFGNDPTQDGAPAPVDPTVDPTVEPVTTDAPDAPSDNSVSNPVDIVVEATTSDAPPSDEPAAEDAPVEAIAPPVAVASIELPEGQEYPLVITTAFGEARFEAPGDTVTVDPQLAALIAETPYAEVAADQPDAPAEETD